MSFSRRILVFGEVLFDVFPNGEQVLGGAPFNVAWHLQALGDQPCFVSRVGEDAAGSRILAAMCDWGMETSGVQHDSEHATGRVAVDLIDDEPHYRIVAETAYDFIDPQQVPEATAGDILYHGSLGIRHKVSRAALERLREAGPAVFLDVNLRAPWWSQESLAGWLETARWIKLNLEELRLLGFSDPVQERALEQFQSRFRPEQVILTRGESGALVRSLDGDLSCVAPDPVAELVDTVGAGDAFSAVYLHGLAGGWPIRKSLETAQRFAAKIIGRRGAVPGERSFYREFITAD